MKTNIKLLDMIEETTQKYRRAKAQARDAIKNIALSISSAPSDTGIRSGGHGSRPEAGAIMQVEAEQKADALHEELQALRRQLRPYVWGMKSSAEKTALRMYYLNGQGLRRIAEHLKRKHRAEWTAEEVLDALQRGVEELRKKLQ